MPWIKNSGIFNLKYIQEKKLVKQDKVIGEKAINAKSFWFPNFFESKEMEFSTIAPNCKQNKNGSNLGWYITL